MARRRNQGRTWRCNPSISEEAAERLKAYAASVDRRPTTAAAEVLLAGLAAAAGGAGEELAELRRRNQELHDQVDALRRGQLENREAADAADDEPQAPRWERPVEELLADTRWWDRWLPRLCELLGRGETGFDYLDGDGEAPTDARGYTDLMGRLCPPIGLVTWRSPSYPAGCRRDRIWGRGRRPWTGDKRPHVGRGDPARRPRLIRTRGQRHRR